MSYKLSSRYAHCKHQDESPLSIEHSYSKLDWNCGELYLPTTYLFSEKKCKHFPGEHTLGVSHVDVESTESGSDNMEDERGDEYDKEKARLSMEECERYAQLVEISGDSDEQENPYSKNTLVPDERKVYRKIVKILKSDRLARLAYKQLPKEAILRRITSNRSARLIKMLLSKVDWDPIVTSKLHMKLITSIPRSLLPVYLDVLQTLMTEIPRLIEPMLRTHMLRLNISANEAMDLLLSTPWCPVSQHINKQALTLHSSIKRPTFLFIHDTPRSDKTADWKRRLCFLSRQLSSIGRVIKILDWQRIRRLAGDPEGLVEVCLRKISRKVAEIRSIDPDSPVVLIGRSFTSLLACEVSSVEKVDAIVCLGFPMSDQCRPCVVSFDVPALFFVGDKDGNGRVELVEKFRSTFRAMTGLVVVRGADKQLRISQSKQMIEEVLQPMADRCMMEKLAEFLNIVLRQNKHPVSQQPLTEN